MDVTTIHKEIGYTNNVQIVERALRERFGFNDNSYMLTAVAAHVWSYICGTSNCDGKITWGTTQVEWALEACQARLDKMKETLQGRRVQTPFGGRTLPAGQKTFAEVWGL